MILIQETLIYVRSLNVQRLIHRFRKCRRYFKIAMIEMARRLKEEKLQATMLLQVHDELVLKYQNQN